MVSSQPTVCVPADAEDDDEEEEDEEDEEEEEEEEEEAAEAAVVVPRRCLLLLPPPLLALRDAAVLPSLIGQVRRRDTPSGGALAPSHVPRPPHPIPCSPRPPPPLRPP